MMQKDDISEEDTALENNTDNVTSENKAESSDTSVTQNQQEDVDVENQPQTADIEDISENEDYSSIYEQDFESIKSKYPYITQANVSELGDDFLKMMAEGCTDPVKAYELTHIDQIIDHRMQEKIQKAYGKQHLKRIRGNAELTAQMPQNVYRQYKRLLPDISDEEIRKHWLSSLND